MSVKTYPPSIFGSWATCIQPSGNSNYILLFTDNYSSDLESVGIMKINDNGDTLWTRNLDSGEANKVIQLANGGYAVLYRKQFLEQSSTGFALIILDSSGNVTIKKIFKEYPNVYANSIIENLDGTFIICAYDGRNSTDKILLIKTDSDGNVQKVNEYDGRTDYFTVPLIQTKDNNYMVAGFYNHNILIYRLSANGEIIWKKYFTDYAESIGGNIITTADGGFVVSGYVFDNTDNLYHTILIKTNSLGSNLSDNPTAITNSNKHLFTFNLSQNYPNPFNPVTKIEYSIPYSSSVTLKVYDLLGREVATLVNEEKPTGSYEVEFDGGRLTSGIYFYHLKAGEYSEIKKMILLK